MSASREKKKRQEFLASGGVDPKAQRAAEQQAAEKKAKTLYTLLAVLFVAVTAFLLVFNSGVLQRNKTAVTINGTDYSVVDTSFYYNSAYQNTIQSMGGATNAALFGLDSSKSLKEQTASSMMLGTATDMTWDEFFKDQAVSSMRFVSAVLAKAEAENLTLDDADMATLDASIQSMKDQATGSGYTYKSYLRAVFGAGMTPGRYESLVKDNLLADKYVTNYTGSISFTDEEIQAYYEENKNTYDLVDGAYVIVNAALETKTDDSGNTIEPTDEEVQTAMDAAKKQADEILSAYKKGEDLKTLSEGLENASYYGSEDISYYSGISDEWFFADERKDGDSEVLEDTSGRRYYVMVFNSRRQDTALDYNVRHILVDDTSVETQGDAEVTDEMVAAKAQEILDSWNGTEEGFATLAEEHSTDPGSNTNGGLYENVAKGDMVATFNDWCYEEGRKSGDTGIVSTTYGQHIMYFVSYGETEYWEHACRTALTSEAATAWQNEVMESVTAEVQPGMDSVGF